MQKAGWASLGCWDVQEAGFFQVLQEERAVPGVQHHGQSPERCRGEPGRARELPQPCQTPSKPGPKRHICWSLKSLQGWGLRLCAGHPLNDEIFPSIQSKPLLGKLEPFSVGCLFLGCLLPGYNLLPGSIKVLPQPPFLLSPLSHSSSNLCSRPPPHLCCSDLPKNCHKLQEKKKKKNNFQVLLYYGTSSGREEKSLILWF